MYKIEVIKNSKLDELLYTTTLRNGLKIYICKKAGYKKKIGMFGTKYGSVVNDFVDKVSGKRVTVPSGVAHFLEHKLFEQEGANALDLFTKIGVSSNAYTSFDQTVYFFETVDKFNEALELLIKLVKTPYFTDENVKKEQGIIGQEINMYEDNSDYVAYFNTLIAMYNKNPVRIDIAGTIDSISKITKETLYTCYNTFYKSSNMFLVVVGDVDIENTIKIIEDNIKIYEKDYGINSNSSNIEIFEAYEEEHINKKIIEKQMDIYMPQICIGYKLNIVEKNEIIKRDLVSSLVSDIYFSKSSKFFTEEYEKGIISDVVSFNCESTKTFSHAIISGYSTKIDLLKEDLLKYIEQIRNSLVDKDLFELAKRKKIGNTIFRSDNLDNSYRRIIDSILNENDVYEDIDIIDRIEVSDISDFLKLLDSDKQVVSIIRQK
ncbi:MAG: insulinase family protein [Clostridia bacterium]|nr:insulinase family protein [Clostridia bacterium]